MTGHVRSESADRGANATATPLDLSPEQTARRRSARGEPVWRWFEQRQRSHAYLRHLAEDLDASSAERLLAERLADPGDPGPRVAYVHIPFCDEICTFCAFFRQVSRNDERIEAYVDALCRQIARLAHTPWAQARAFDAIYLGGGTPTVLSAVQMTRLLEQLRELPVSDDGEVTVETRCRRMSSDYLQALVAAGVNRLSVGVQSFDTAVRQGTRRLADRAEVLSRLAEARDAGLTRLSIDLIYNLPGQTSQTWASTLATLDQTPVIGCSVYALVPQPESVLGRQLARDELALGDLSREYAYHRSAMRHFARREGWRRFSSVHFGDTAVETHRYNRVRGAAVDVLGFGAGAAWRVGEINVMNRPAVEQFVDSHRAGRPAPLHASRSTAAASCSELFALVDGAGIDYERLTDALPGWRADLDALIETGLIRCDGGWCELTEAGCFWAYNIGELIGRAIGREARRSPPLHN